MPQETQQTIFNFVMSSNWEINFRAPPRLIESDSNLQSSLLWGHFHVCKPLPVHRQFADRTVRRQDTLLIGQLADRTVRWQDSSLTRQFADKTVRLWDSSPTRQFADKTVRRQESWLYDCILMPNNEVIDWNVVVSALLAFWMKLNLWAITYCVKTNIFYVAVTRMKFMKTLHFLTICLKECVRMCYDSTADELICFSSG